MSTNKLKPITVIGGANVDIVARYHAQQSCYADSFAGQITTSAGGVARNIAENLGHLGNPVRMICGIGDDAFAKVIVSSLTMPLIDISACYFCADSPSDTYLSTFDHEGELLHAINQMALVDKLTCDYLHKFENEIRDSSLIVADSNIHPESIDWLVNIKDRPKLVFDGVSSQKILKLKPYLGQFDGLKCNYKEAIELTGLAQTAAPPELMDALTGFGLKTVILSLGSKGVFYSQTGEDCHMAKDKEKVKPVSVSGAGDALFAGLIHGQLHGLTVRNSLKLGLQAARLTLCCSGAVNPDVASLV